MQLPALFSILALLLSISARSRARETTSDTTDSVQSSSTPPTELDAHRHSRLRRSPQFGAAAFGGNFGGNAFAPAFTPPAASFGRFSQFAGQGQTGSQGNTGGQGKPGGEGQAGGEGQVGGEGKKGGEGQAGGEGITGGNANNSGGKTPGPAVPKLNDQSGLTLQSANVQKISAGPVLAGQVQSAVSNGNFINFCSGKTLTNGKQVQGGSCNPTPIGDIPSTQNMVSTVFESPANFATIPANADFTIALRSQNIIMGSFTDPQGTYYAAPQQLQNGQVVGHAHVVIQKMDSLQSTKVLSPNTFAFFKGFDFADTNGLSSLNVPGGLGAGAYRMCTIMSASNHQSVIMPVAQRGAENTCSYFTCQ